jgi:hypothetical protein
MAPVPPPSRIVGDRQHLLGSVSSALSVWVNKVPFAQRWQLFNDHLQKGIFYILCDCCGCREPLYPPVQVSVEIGPTPNQLHSVATFAVRATHEPQRFQLPRQCCLGAYLKLRFQGKLQEQLIDRQYYHAIRYLAGSWAVCVISSHSFPPCSSDCVLCCCKGT